MKLKDNPGITWIKAIVLLSAIGMAASIASNQRWLTYVFSTILWFSVYFS